MQNIDSMPELGDVDDSVLTVLVDANFADARPNSGHWFPIARCQTALNHLQFVAHLLADSLGERPHSFQAVPHPFNRLKPS